MTERVREAGTEAQRPATTTEVADHITADGYCFTVVWLDRIERIEVKASRMKHEETQCADYLWF